MIFYQLNTALDYAIEFAQQEEVKNGKLSALLGISLAALNRGGLIEALPSGYKTTSNQESYLRGILYGGQVIAHEVLTVTSSLSVSLGSVLGGIPANSKYAFILVEGDPGLTDAEKTKVIRFKQTGENPTNLIGIPIGELGVFEIKLPINMINFRCIGVKSGASHKIQVEYYG